MEIGINLRKLHSLCEIRATFIKSLIISKNCLRMTSTVGSKADNKFAIIADDDYEILQLEKEREIDVMRNKSGLREQHQNLVHGRIPYNKPVAESHFTFKYKRMMFGKFGKLSNVNPGTLWPNKSDINKVLEYEAIAYPISFEQLVEKQKKIKEEEMKKINERQQKIQSNLQKLETWKKEIAAKSEKKLADMAKAKAQKDALIEEVRRHFGYKIDPKDEKFKEMLLLKEKAQKKKLKEEKSKAKQERLISELTKKEVK